MRNNPSKVLIPLFGCFMIVIAILIDGVRQGASQEKLLQNRIDSVSRKYDSISDELISTETELNRYETAYKIFLGRNPKAASQYGTIISEETE